MGKTNSPSSRTTPDRGSDRAAGSEFPVVGIGASAGGLEAFTGFFKNMPSDSGMAFILIQH